MLAADPLTTDPPPDPAIPPRKRRKTDRRCRDYRGFKWIRVVAGGAVQARVYVGPGRTDQINLGCFSRYKHEDPARAAGLIAREFLNRASRPGVSWLDVLAAMRAEGKTRALPRWVRRHPEG